MAEQKVIGIASKSNHVLTGSIAAEIFSWISSKGFDYRLDIATASALNQPTISKGKVIERQQLTTQCDVIVVLGGDGTLISVSRHPSPRKSIIVGVNLGTLGFLTEVTTEEVFPALQSAIDGSAQIKTRPLLLATLYRNNKKASQYYSINDVVITKEAMARIFSVEVTINKDLAATIRGDGVIVATPGGSTAYNLAAGGSIVYPTVEANLITPICSHSLSSRPLVIPSSAQITLAVKYQHKTEQDKVFLTVDGQEGEPLEPNDQIIIESSPHCAYFVKSPTKNFFDILRTKLGWIHSK